MAGVFFLLRLYENNLKRGKRFKAMITSVVDEGEIPEDLAPAK